VTRRQLQNPDSVPLAVHSTGGWEFNPAPESAPRPQQSLVAMTTPLGRLRIEAALSAAA
jgi:hypothetical protein